MKTGPSSEPDPENQEKPARGKRAPFRNGPAEIKTVVTQHPLPNQKQLDWAEKVLNDEEAWHWEVLLADRDKGISQMRGAINGIIAGKMPDLLRKALEKAKEGGILDEVLDPARRVAGTRGQDETQAPAVKAVILGRDGLLDILLENKHSEKSAGAALCWSASMGHMETLKKLIAHGADPTCKNHRAIFWATENEKEEIVRFLLGHYNDQQLAELRAMIENAGKQMPERCPTPKLVRQEQNLRLTRKLGQKAKGGMEI
jgi:hypothetical protein